MTSTVRVNKVEYKIIYYKNAPSHPPYFGVYAFPYDNEGSYFAHDITHNPLILQLPGPV